MAPVLNKLLNYNVDPESEWAKQYAVVGLPGASVFYQPDVSTFIS